MRAAAAQLVEASEWRWILLTSPDLDTLRSLLSQFPEAGRELNRDGAKTLRRLKLHRTPYLVWYSFDPERGAGIVELYRLFHARQLTPDLRLR